METPTKVVIPLEKNIMSPKSSNKTLEEGEIPTSGNGVAPSPNVFVSSSKASTFPSIASLEALRKCHSPSVLSSGQRSSSDVSTAQAEEEGWMTQQRKTRNKKINVDGEAKFGRSSQRLTRKGDIAREIANGWQRILESTTKLRK